MSPRAIFVHGRPSHPFHQALARSIGAEMLAKDFLLPFQGTQASRLRRYLSWVLASACFPQLWEYDLLLTEGPIFLPLLLRTMGRRRPEQRVVGLIANETPYFLWSGFYRAHSGMGLKAALRSYDALICVGAMHRALVKTVLGSAHPPLYEVPSAIDPERMSCLLATEPDLDSKRVVSVSHLAAPWRAYYKGMDLLFSALAQVKAQVQTGGTSLSFELVGDLTGPCKDLVRHSFGDSDWVSVRGPTSDLGSVFGGAALLVQLSRGDAGPLTVLEAMAAGVPALVSCWTGLRDAVAEVDPRLVVPLSAPLAAERIAWYLQLSPASRRQLSQRARQVAQRYTQSTAQRAFQRVIAEIRRGQAPKVAPSQRGGNNVRYAESAG